MKLSERISPKGLLTLVILVVAVCLFFTACQPTPTPTPTPGPSQLSDSGTTISGTVIEFPEKGGNGIPDSIATFILVADSDCTLAGGPQNIGGSYTTGNFSAGIAAATADHPSTFMAIVYSPSADHWPDAVLFPSCPSANCGSPNPINFSLHKVADGVASYALTVVFSSAPLGSEVYTVALLKANGTLITSHTYAAANHPAGVSFAGLSSDRYKIKVTKHDGSIVNPVVPFSMCNFPNCKR